MPEDRAIYKHAFWLYGVIIGLAIKQALDAIVPHWLDPNKTHPPLGFYLEILRLFTFLFLAIRFYLGSAFYFGTVHEAEDVDPQFEMRSFGTDFVIGFLHFLGFVFLALTIEVHGNVGIRLFPLGIAFVLGYDVVWFLFSLLWKLDTRKKIMWWAIVNGIVIILCTALYLIVEKVTGNSITSEVWALWIVFLVTLLDIGWMMKKTPRPFFEPIRDFLTK